MNKLLFKIIWKDARSFTELFPEELNEKLQKGLAIYEAYGLIIGETDDVIALCPYYLPAMEKNDDYVYRHVLFVPKKMITEMKKLQEKGVP